MVLEGFFNSSRAEVTRIDSASSCQTFSARLGLCAILLMGFFRRQDRLIPQEHGRGGRAVRELSQERMSVERLSSATCPGLASSHYHLLIKMASSSDANAGGTNMNTVKKGKSPIYSSQAQAEHGDGDGDGLNGEVDGDETAGLLSSSESNGNGRYNRATSTISDYWNSFKLSIVSTTSTLMGSPRKASKRRATPTQDDGESQSSNHLSLGQRFNSFKSKHPTLLKSFIGLSILFLLFLLFYLVAIIHLVFWTLKPPSSESQTLILDQSLLLKGPDSISLLNVSDEGILIQLNGRLGLDPDEALDLWLGKTKDLGWWKRKERNWIEWSIGRVGGIRIETGEIVIGEPDWNLDLKEEKLGLLDPPKKEGKEHSISILSDKSTTPADLLSFHIQPLTIPLPALKSQLGKHKNDSESLIDQPPILGNHSTHRAKATLHPLNLTLLLRPVSPAPLIMEVVKKALHHNKAVVDLNVKSLRVRGIQRNEMKKKGAEDARTGGGLAGWVDMKQSNIIKRLAQQSE